MAGPSGPAYMRKDGYFMKAMKRRLLSLFMAMVMVCSLVPVALAAGDLTATISGVNTSVTLSNNSAEVKPGVALDSQTADGYTIDTYSWLVSGGEGASVSGETTATPTVTFTRDGTFTISVSGSAKKGSETKNYSASISNIAVSGYQDPTPVATSIDVASALQLTVGKTNETSKALTATVKDQNGAAMTGNSAPDVSYSTDSSLISLSATSAKSGTPITVSLTTDANAITTRQTAEISVSTTGITNPSKVTVTINPPDLTATVSGTPTMKLGATQDVTLTKSAGVTGDVVWHSSNETILSVGTGSQTGTTVTALKQGSAKIWATIGTGDTAVKSNEYTITVDNPIKITISGNSSGSASSSTLNGINSMLSLTVSTDVAAGGPTIDQNSIQWTASNSNVSIYGTTGTTLSVYAASVGTTDVSVSLRLSNGQTATASQKITVASTANFSISASVFEDSAGYALGDDDDKGKDSIIDQIDAKLGSSRYCEYIWFDTTTHTKGDLDAYKSNSSHSTNTAYTVDEAADVIFTPDSSAKKGDVATFEITVEDDRRTTYTFELSFTLIDGSGASAGDITYTASLGEEVPFEVSDFEDFYATKFPSGNLDYVTFGSSSSNGTLYNEDGKSAGSTPYYVSPSSRQKALDGIYFSPRSSMKTSTTVKISFTAYGTKRNNTGEGEVSGTVSILYLNDSAKDITYNTTGGKVTLDPKDFEEAYKDATGSKTAPSNLTIEFQDVPSNGTLTYTGGSRDKDLTRSNVKSTRYTTRSSGSNRLAQLTYSGTKGKDTISYIAYSGSTAQFTGKVVFNGAAAVPTDVVVTYGSTGGQAVAFSQNDFVRANSVMSNAVKVRFTVPANGTLQMSGANAAGIDIAASLLGSVSYKPRAGFNGTDKIIFAAYDASNAVVASGSVNVTVVGNPSTGTSGGTNPGGVTDVSQFKDVSSTAWYRNDLATLVSQGIITGKGEGKFDPLGTVTYGEALKMILEACGYTATLGTGSNWAINYKNLAVSNGWISSSIDLNAAISRNATAELAARVMGVAPATSGSPFADEANAYAVALYYTNPQIFVGDNTTGKLLFKNGSPLLRQEVCAVICRIRTYHTQHTTNTMPDGI